jgi:hypothetical protein
MMRQMGAGWYIDAEVGYPDTRDAISCLTAKHAEVAHVRRAEGAGVPRLWDRRALFDRDMFRLAQRA